VLRQLIRFHGDRLHSLLREYLERNVVLFMDQQAAFHDQLRSTQSGHPLNTTARDPEQDIGPPPPLAGDVVADADDDSAQQKIYLGGRRPKLQ
jgi:hypothetical protein